MCPYLSPDGKGFAIANPMKALLRALVAISLICLVVSPGLAADFGQADKQKHIGATAGISAVTYSVARRNSLSKTKSLLWAVGLSMGVGIAKELSDPTFDNEDLQADVIGACLGTFVSWSFEF